MDKWNILLVIYQPVYGKTYMDRTSRPPDFITESLFHYHQEVSSQDWILLTFYTGTFTLEFLHYTLVFIGIYALDLLTGFSYWNLYWNYTQILT